MFMQFIYPLPFSPLFRLASRGLWLTACAALNAVSHAALPDLSGNWTIVDFGTGKSTVFNAERGDTLTFFDGNEFDVTEVSVNSDGTLSSGGEPGSWFIWDQTFIARSDEEAPESYSARFSPDGSKAITAYWETIPFTPSEPGSATYRPVYLSIGVKQATTPATFAELANTQWIRLQQTITGLEAPSSGGGTIDLFVGVEHSVDEISLNGSSGFSVTSRMNTDDPAEVGQTFSGNLINSSGNPAFDLGDEVVLFPTLNDSRDLALVTGNESNPVFDDFTRFRKSVQLFVNLPPAVSPGDVVGRWLGSTSVQEISGASAAIGGGSSVDLLQTRASNFTLDFLPDGTTRFRYLNRSPNQNDVPDPITWSIDGNRLRLTDLDGVVVNAYLSANRDFIAVLNNEITPSRSEFNFAVLVKATEAPGLAARTQATATLPTAGGNPIIGVSSEPGFSYQLQRSEGLGETWSNIGNPIPGTGSPVSAVDSAPLPDRGFYRWRVIKDLP